MIEWLDISQAANVPEGLPSWVTLHDLMRRFTITRHDGKTVSGGPGFIALWRSLGPTWWLGRLFDHAPGHALGEIGYRAFLRMRRFWR